MLLVLACSPATSASDTDYDPYSMLSATEFPGCAAKHPKPGPLQPHPGRLGAGRLAAH